jgi:hypothetical protein
MRLILETEKQVADFLCQAALALADQEEGEITVTTLGYISPAGVAFVLRGNYPGCPEFQVSVLKR